MPTAYANTFSITCPELTSVSIVDDSFQITSGQPVTSMGVTHSGSTWSVTVTCGRSGSASLAQDYIRQAKGEYNMFVYPTYSGTAGRYDNIPTAMNFYFAINLAFSGHAGTMWLGQDGVDLINFWWMGGDLVLNSSPYASPMAYVITPLGLYKASFLNQNVYQIGMTPAV